VTDFVTWMNRLPDALVYLALALGAAVENLVPAIPADTFVALGGFLAGAGNLDPWWVALTTWAANVVGALFVYWMSHRHGPPFFDRGLGRHVVRPHQMERIRGFYAQWGTPAIFFSRFLPGVRSIVPVFAGVTHMRLRSVAIPIAAASAIWYGGLVQLGLFAGRNLEFLDRILSGLNRTLAVVALIVGGLVALWWVLSRRYPDDLKDDGRGDGH
jgi:membrane protein DedA with SNARE-associated domain